MEKANKEKVLKILNDTNPIFLKELIIKNIESDLISVKEGRISKEILYLDGVCVTQSMTKHNSYAEAVGSENEKN